MRIARAYPAGMPQTARNRESWAFVLTLAGVAGFLASHTTGIVCSNDASHIALSRALAVRGETRIDPDWRLTDGVDLAWHEGHYYSDRPPGTGFAAIPAAWLGAKLDHPLLARSKQQGTLVVEPASPAMRNNYAHRFPRASPLHRYQGTAWTIGLHAVLVGALGLVFVEGLLRRWAVPLGGRLFALVVCGLASLWGPYSTALFSHGTTMTSVAGFALGVEVLRRDAQPKRAVAPLAGFAGGMAVASEYSLITMVPLAALMIAPRRHWAALAAGALPVAVATGAYHQAAFGSPIAIGYQHHVTFEFARKLNTTFGGNFFDGLWTLLGAGHGAGVAVRSPVLYAGLLALLLPPSLHAADAAGDPQADDRTARRWLLAFTPWLALLAFHQTPWGGGTRDYRYLTPLLPILAVGLGLAWQRWGGHPASAFALLAVAAYSGFAVWSGFTGFHGGALGSSPRTGVAVALAFVSVGGAALIWSRPKSGNRDPRADAA
jgi:hypothetical protein